MVSCSPGEPRVVSCTTYLESDMSPPLFLHIRDALGKSLAVESQKYPPAIFEMKVPSEGDTGFCSDIMQNEAGGIVFKPSDAALTALAHPTVQSGIQLFFFHCRKFWSVTIIFIYCVVDPSCAPGGFLTTKEWICISERGVAYRNSTSMNDRYETTRGPDHNMKVNVLRERVGNEKNWLELDVAGHGKKYLPIKRKAKLCSSRYFNFKYIRRRRKILLVGAIQRSMLRKRIQEKEARICV